MPQKNNFAKVLELDKILAMLKKEAVTQEAKEAVTSLIPQTQLAKAQTLLDETAAAYHLINQLGAIPISEVQKVCADRAQVGGILSIKELLEVAKLLKVIHSLKAWNARKNFETVLDPKFEKLSENKYLEQKISLAIISENEIADEASEDLLSIRRKIRANSNKIREQLDIMIHSSHYQKYLQEPIVTIRDGRFVVPVKSEYRANVQGFVHSASASGSTVFVEPITVIQANNELKILHSSEKAEIEKIIAALSQEVGGFAKSILSSYNLVIKLDVIFAKAKLACIMRATLPILNSDGIIVLKKARHPLVNNETVVPVDISLGCSFDSLVITGPNTGGKTVIIKIIGLFALMSALGLFIPAQDSSRVCIFKNILTDIGDEQSIEQSLSTFSGHISNIKDIIEIADSNSLVLLDELGAGTDPIEGAAIAISILEYLRKQKAKIAVTTHYAELKEYAIVTPDVENGCCEFDTQTLLPTYRLLIGIPGKSNAFAISQRLGIKKEIIDKAKNIISHESRNLEEIISQLGEKRLQTEKEYQELQKLTHNAKKEAEEIKKIKISLQKQNDVYLQKAKEKARKIVEKAKNQAELFLNELKIMQKNKRDILNEDKSWLKKQVKELEESVNLENKISNEGYKLPRKLKKGDLVLIVDINKEATVLQEKDHSDMVLLQVGIIKTRVKLDNLKLLKNNNPSCLKNRMGFRNIKSDSESKVTSEINLRGYNILDATDELDKFIDSSILTGISQITIIHGKGTGTLRTGIHKYLKSHSYILEYRLGNYGEGDTGVTIAQLRT